MYNPAGFTANPPALFLYKIVFHSYFLPTSQTMGVKLLFFRLFGLALVRNILPLRNRESGTANSHFSRLSIFTQTATMALPDIDS